MQGAGSGVQSDALGCSAIRSEIPFKGLDFSTQNELATIQNAGDRCVNFGLDAPVLRFQIEVGYFDVCHEFLGLLLQNAASQPGGYALGNMMIWDIVSDHSAGADHCALSNGDASEDDCAAADGCPSLYTGGNDLPIIFRLQAAVRRRSRIKIVDKHDPVSHEDVVFNGDALTDEGVR